MHDSTARTPRTDERHARASLAPAKAVSVPPLPEPDAFSLHTERMTLRPLTPGDQEAFLRTIALSREHLARFSPLHQPGESDEQLFARQLRLTRVGLEHGTALRLVGVAPDGRISGAFNLNSITRGLSFTGDCNWWVSAEFLGAGYGAEGVRALVDHALADLPSGLGLHAIHAWITRENQPSQHLARVVGFRPAGDERSYLRSGDAWTLHDLWIRTA